VPRFLEIVLAFIGGLVAGEGLAILGYIVATNFFGVFDRDGGGAMGAIFIIGPVLAVIFAIVFALVAAVRSARPR